MWVFSHGGLNAAPVEAALYAKARGLFVVAVTCAANQRTARATHSSGKKLGDIADVVIDNCAPPEDALVAIDGWPYAVAAASTVAAIAISMTLLAEVARRLAARGFTPPRICVSECATRHAEQQSGVPGPRGPDAAVVSLLTYDRRRLLES